MELKGVIMNIRKNRAIILLTPTDEHVTADLSNQLKAFCKQQAFKNPRFIRAKSNCDLRTFNKIARVISKENVLGNKLTVIIAGNTYNRADDLFILCTLGALSTAKVINIYTYEYNKYCKTLHFSYLPEPRVRTLYTATKYFKHLLETTQKQHEQTAVIQQQLSQLANLINKK